MRMLKIAALMASLLFLVGCGSAAVGAVMYFMPEDEEEPETMSADAPVVIISPVSGVHSGDIDVNYTLTDRNSDPVNILVEYLIDSGGTYTTATMASGSEPTTGRSSSPTGVAHLFVWDSLADVGTGTVNTVRLRLTPSDTEPGLPAATQDFTVDNTPPSVEIMPLTGVQSGEVTVAYKISDGASDLASIVVEYSIDGGTNYSPATEDIGSSFTEGTTNLASSAPPGTLHIFAWNSVADCPGFRCPDEEGERLVRIRVTPSDFLPGLPVATSNFALDNNIPPAVTVETPGAPLPKKGNVVINYTLYDAESDECSISVLYSVTGGLTWAQAIKGSGGDPVEKLDSSSTGTSHTYVWNSIANLGYCSETQVMIRISPYDTKWGIRDQTDLFPVDNNLAPSASIVTPSGEESGDIYILYYLFDGGSDTIEITADYSPDGGGNWYPATLSASAPEGTTLLQSSPTGYPHFFLWDSATDMPGQFSDKVIFRIKPTDEFLNEGDYAHSGEFIVSNNSAPSVLVSTPSSPAAGDITISYDLYDDESQDCSIVVEYTVGTEGTWHPATMASGSEPTTPLTSSPAGVAHSFTWNSAADIDTLEENVRVRITPYDFPGRAGTPGITASFDVDNADWATPEQVVPTSSTSIYPAVHASPDGTVHLVWEEYVVNKYQIYYAKKSGNKWSVPQDISSGSRSCYYPDVVSGADDTVHVVWIMEVSNDDQVFYRKFDGSKWLTTVQLTSSSDDVDAPSVDLDEDNNPWVVYAQIYSGWYQTYCSRYDGENWLPREKITSSESHRFVTIRSGPGGIMHITDRRDRDNPGKVYYSTHDGAAWSGSQTVASYSNRYLYEPDLSIDGSGNAHIVWTRDNRLYYSTNAGGSWSSAVQFTTSSSCDRPQVASYAPDNVHTAWYENDDTVYYSHYDGSSWSVKERIDVGSGAAREPYMRMGLDGRIHLVFHQWDGSDWQIQYTSR